MAGDVGWVGGLGVTFSLGGVDLTAELRHTRGMLDLTGWGNRSRSTSTLVGIRR